MQKTIVRLLILFLLPTNPIYAAQHGDGVSSGGAAEVHDFSNYFIEKELIQKTNQIPGIAPDTIYLENRIEAALFSIIRRLQVPHVDPDHPKNSDGSPNIVTKDFFAKVEAKIKAQDPDAKAYAAGGVVRSLLGYIYKKVYNAHQKTPPESTEKALERIINEEKRKGGSKNEILSLAALGVGSDLDILIDSPSGKAREEAIKNEVTEFINSAEAAAGLRDTKTRLKYAVVPIGDVKSYHNQITRTTSQGGSTLDWLAFPLTKRSGEHMIMPEGHPDIFKKFLLGEYDYLPPTNSSELNDPDKQTIRGLRPLIEVPYLHLSKAGAEQMKRELTILITKAKRGEELSSGAYDQFEKMIRNARFQGAHNRFYSFGTIPSDSRSQTIETLVYQLSQASKRGEKNLPLIPEFLMNRDLKHRSKDEDKCGLSKAGLLMDHETFLKDHTDHGSLYHGTPRLDNILSVIRNGFVVSSDKQGMASFGRGSYSTKDRATTEGYGIAIKFDLKEGVVPRVLDWQKVKTQPELLSVLKDAKEKDVDEFRYLAESCDVDFIVNGHVLIQNSGAIQLPKNIKALIEASGASIQVKKMRVNFPRMKRTCC